MPWINAIHYFRANLEVTIIVISVSRSCCSRVYHKSSLDIMLLLFIETRLSLPSTLQCPVYFRLGWRAVSNGTCDSSEDEGCVRSNRKSLYTFWDSYWYDPTGKLFKGVCSHVKVWRGKQNYFRQSSTKADWNLSGQLVACPRSIL